MRAWLALTAPLVLTASIGIVPAAAAPLPLPQPEATVPTGFVDTAVASVNGPTTVAGLPDGRVVVLTKAGQVRIISGGVLLATPALIRSVCTNSEQGLLGFTADPDFATNGFVYIYYTRPSAGAPGGCVNRASRFHMTGNTISAASELVLVDNIGSQAGNHNGGDLAVGNDGYLYISVGDGGCYLRNSSLCATSNPSAQDVSLLNGKILRVQRSNGFAAPDNPLVNRTGAADCRVRGNTPSTPTTPCKEIFAWGLRNPWRFAFDPNTGATRFFINDVGQNTREEVDQGAWGANYGWPAREGQCPWGQNPGPNCPPPDPALGYTQPLTDYPHNTVGDYITGAAFIPNGAWPEQYDGGYLFADGNPGRIFFRDRAGDPVAYAGPVDEGGGLFAQNNLAAISDMTFVMEPTGWALYYVLAFDNTNSVHKIVYQTTPAPSPGTLSYAPLAAPSRVYDTRNLGADSGPMRAGTSRLVDVNAPSASTKAVLVNLTLVRPTATAFLTAWTPRTSRPATSNINAGAGEVTANAAILPVDAEGKVVVFSNATTNVIVDVLGYFNTAVGTVTAGRLTPLTPVRAVDTRNPFDVNTNNFTVSGSTVNVPLSGRFGVTANVSAVAVIVTALGSAGPGSGYVVVSPGGAATPASSNVNVNGNGDRRANLVVVPLGGDGSIDLLLNHTDDVLVDIVGTFTNGSAASSDAGLFVPVAPAREVDTRINLGFSRLAANTVGTRNPASVPDTAIAVAQNITLTRTAGSGFVTAFPAGTTQPVVSNGNAVAANQTTAAMAITSLGTGGAVSYGVSMATDLIADVSGYFTAGSA